jgi:hypothetical protein
MPSVYMASNRTIGQAKILSGKQNGAMMIGKHSMTSAR